jgi:ribosomal protein S12 methylthiotransferase accessory factor
MAEMKITFPGGKKVNAQWHGFEISTDQPAEAGGTASAPSDYDLFLASLGTCAGIFVLGFIQSRGLSTEGLKIIQSMEMDPATQMVKKVSFKIVLPKGFPEKYKAAVIKAAEQCSVKRAIHNPPAVEITAD